MNDTLETPLTFTKNNLTITTTVKSTRNEGESEADFVARHLSLVEAVITNRGDNGWTLVSE